MEPVIEKMQVWAVGKGVYFEVEENVWIGHTLEWVLRTTNAADRVLSAYQKKHYSHLAATQRETLELIGDKDDIVTVSFEARESV